VTGSPKVSIIVLSYNRPALLREVLRSVSEQTYPADRLEVLVVDNRSPKSAEIASVVADSPRAQLIASDENLGFTGGMNLGLRRASGELVYLTEDDVVLAPENVAELVRYMSDHPDVGMVGGIMHHIEDRSIWCAGGDVELTPRYRVTIHGEGEADRGQYPEPFAVTYLPGNMMMARASTWRELGGFRDDFFMYCEDVELCLRLRRGGRRLVVVPTARCYQFTPVGASFSPVVAFHRRKNMTALYLLHAPTNALPRSLLSQTLADLREICRSPSHAATALRAYGYLVKSLPRLLRDRQRIQAQRT
jgi:GT2 family glycosyltransferase